MSATVQKSRKAAVIGVLASLIASAGLAFAAPAQAAGNIDPNQARTLTIHKYEAPEWDKAQYPNNGTRLTAPQDAKSIDGVKFRITKIEGIDLSKAADWDKAKKLAAVKDGSLTAVPGATKGASQEVTTAGGGTATYNPPAIGVYLVEEIEAPAKVTKKADPFFVTVPLPAEGLTGAVNGWLYDIHVYPKNATSEVTKTVGDNTSTTSVGSDIEWVITAKIPAGKDLAGLKITDKLDSKVKYTDTQGKTVPTVTIKDTNVTLTQGTDYTLTTPAEAGATIALELTAEGLKKVNANKEKTLIVSFYTKVVQELADNQVPNKGAVVNFKNDPNGEWTPVKPGPDPQDPTPDPNNPGPTAFFGDYKAKKVSATGGETLKGAKFGLYPTEQDATNGTNLIKEYTSNDQGILEIKDLYRGKADTDTKNYFLKETEAPAGFKLDATVRTIAITKTSGSTANADLDVPNTPYTQDDLPKLPLTGAAGQLLLTLGGAAVLMAATGTVLVTRRKKD